MPPHARINPMKERWMKVASAPNEVQALLMEGLLRESDIPVLIQRAPGFDVPEFLAAGPRSILVPTDFLEAATEILSDTTGLGSW